MNVRDRESRRNFVLVRELKEQGLSFREIVERLGFSKGYVSNVLTAINRGFDSVRELRNERARRRLNPETGSNFSSDMEYKDYLARQKINPETGKPFESHHEISVYNAKQKGHKNIQRSRMAYLGLERPVDLLDDDARKRGYESFCHYHKILRLLKKPEFGFEEEVVDPKVLEESVSSDDVRDYLSKCDLKGLEMLEEIMRVVVDENVITRRYLEVVKRRYLKGQIRSDIGKSKDFKVTGERIRQIENEAIKKIKGYINDSSVFSIGRI